MDNDSVYTVREVASILKVSEKTVYSLIRDQELSCIWVRGQIRITSTQLNGYLKGGDHGGTEIERDDIQKE